MKKLSTLNAMLNLTKHAFCLILTFYFSLSTFNSQAQVCFSTATNYPTGSYPQAIISADFNADGKADLATGNYSEVNVSVLLGTGTGSFNAATYYSTVQPSSVISADFNNDGILDLAVGSSTTTTYNVSILLGTGYGTFGTATNFGTSYGIEALTSGDFNGDGNIDLAMINYNSPGKLMICLGTGTGSFGASTNTTIGSNLTSITNADFNGDGIIDLAVSGNGNVSILLGTGTGSFGAENVVASDYGLEAVKSADFNGDGKVDLAVLNRAYNYVSILLGTGFGTFGAANNFTIGTGPQSVTITDFNGDGKADLAIANYTSNNVSVLLGTGTGNFGTATNFGAGFSPYSITSADFNGDGKPDVAVANRGSNNVSVLINAAPTPVITGNTSYCANSSTTLDAGFGYASYTWSKSGFVGSAVAVTIADNPISVTVTDTNGCSGISANVWLTENALPTPSITGVTSYCAGDSTTLYDAGNGYPIYNWSNGSQGYSTTATVANNPYTLTVTDVNGCSGVTPPFNVVEVALPTPAITGNFNYCAGSNTTLTASTGYTSYQWSNNDLSQSTTVTQGNYNVIVHDNNGCIGQSAVTTITENALPTVFAGADRTACNGTTITLSGSGASSYIWDNGITNGHPFTPTVGTIGAITYTVTGTDNNGCTNTDTVIITYVSSTIISAGADRTICSGISTTLNATGGASYLWSNGGNSSSINVSPTQTTTYTVSATNACSAILYENFDASNSLPSGWSAIDGDNDGKNWMIVSDVASNFAAHSGTNSAQSESWSSGVALTPDNYLITPQITISSPTTNLSYWVGANDPNYFGEQYSVLLSTTGTQISDFNVVLLPLDTLTTNIWTKVTIPLGSYGSGPRYIAFRHYHVTDMFKIKFDDIVVEDASAPITTDQVVVNVYPLSSVNNPQVIGNGGSYSINGHTYTTTGNYQDSLHTSLGCDSIVTTQLTVNCSQTQTFQSYTSANGLADNYVHSIAADAQGNKWFGTNMHGVSKFNDTSWTTYATDYVSPNQIAGNWVYSITVDSNNNKWFGTDGGVSKFDGSIWTNYTTSGGLVNNEVHGITIDPQGNNWFATWGGVSKYDGTAFTNYTTSNGLASNNVWCAFIDHLGNKWFGTYNGGVSKFNGTTWTTYTAAQGLVENNVKAITEDAQGNMWFATPSGISKFDGISWTTYNRFNSGLADDNTFTIKAESNGIIWITSSGGIYKFDGLTWTNINTTNGLVNNNVTSMTLDAQGNRWFGTQGGVSKFIEGSLVTAEAGTTVGNITCLNPTTTLNGSGNGLFDWTPSSGGIIVSGANTATPTVAAGGIYFLTVTSTNGCTATDNITVTQTSTPPVISAGNDTAICLGVYVNVIASGGTTGANYVWSNGLSGTGFTTTPVATTTYSVTVTNPDGCSNTDEVIINVNNPATAIAGTDQTIMAGFSTLLNSTGNGTPVWNTGQTGSNILANPAQTTTYTVTYSNTCNSAVDNIIVTVVNSGCDTVQSPTFTLACSSSLQILKVGISGSPQSYISGNNTWGDQEKAQKFQFNGTGTISKIYSKLHVASSIVGGNAYMKLYSYNSTTNLPGTLIQTSSAVPLSSITSGEIKTFNFTTPVSISGQFFASLVLPTTTGDTLVVYSTNSDCNTGSSLSYEKWSDGNWHSMTQGWQGLNPDFAIFPEVCLTASAPVADFSASATSVCPGACLSFIDMSVGTPTSWNWSFSGSSVATSTLQNPTNICYNTPGQYDVTLTVGNAQGSNTTTKTSFIVIMGAANANAGNDRYLCSGQSATLYATGGTSYIWSNGSTRDTTVVTPASTSTYTVTVSSPSACADIDTVIVHVADSTYNPITIVNSNLPQIGTRIYQHVDTLPNNIGRFFVGCDVTWNYSNLVENKLDTMDFVSPTGIPGAAQFPNATIVSRGKQNNNYVYNFFQNTPNSFYDIGYAGDLMNNGSNMSIKINPGFSFLTVPATTNTAYTEDYSYIMKFPYSQMPIDSIKTIHHSHLYSNIAASGTITIPGGQSYPCIRQGINEIYSDSVWMHSGTIWTFSNVTIDTSQNYRWWTNGIPVPVVEMTWDRHNLKASKVSWNTLSSTSSINITSQPVSQTKCEGENVTFSVTASGSGTLSYQWYKSGTPNIALPYETGNSYTTSGLSMSNAGSYYCIISGGGGISVTSNSATLTVNPTPNANAGADVSTCAGNSVTLSASSSITGSAFEWIAGDINPIYVISPSLTTTYTVTVSDTNGCSNTDDVVVAVNSVYSINNLQTICSGSSYIFNGHSYSTAGNHYDTLATIHGCDSIVTTQLTVNPTLASTNPQTICSGSSYIFNGHSYSTAGNHYDTLSTIHGCDSVITTQLTVNPVYSTNNPQTICSGSSYVFNGHSYTTEGNHYDTLATINGCDSVITTQLTVNPLPIANAGNDTTICGGSSVTLIASGGISYFWSNGTTGTSNMVNPTQTSTYTVTVSDANYCSATADIVVSVNTSLLASASNDTLICTGSSVTLIASGGTIYNWSNGDNNDSTTVAPTQTTTYYVTVTNNNGCSGTESVVVAVDNVPIINSQSSGLSRCVGENAMFYVSATGTGTLVYNWYRDSINLGINDDTLYVNNVSTLLAGPYICVVSNNCGDVTSNIMFLSVNTIPATITPDGSTNLCQGSSVTLYANAGAYLEYQWLRNDTLIIDSILPYLLVNQSGSYKVIVHSTLAGCTTTSVALAVTVNTADFPIAFSANQQLIYNPPFAVQFTNTTPNRTLYNFIWDFGDGTIMNPPTSNNASVFHQYAYNGTYDVTLIATKITTGCRDTLYQNAFIYCANGSNNPCNITANVTQSGNSTFICPGDSLTIVAMVTPGATIQWSLNNNIISGLDSNTLIAKVPGEYRVIATQGSCNVISDPLIVSQYQMVQPVISSNGNIQPCTNDSMQLNVNTYYQQYYWSNGQAGNNIYVHQSGNYFVNVTDLHGCVAKSNIIDVNATILTTPEICLVTVDSALSNYNVILWDKPITNLIDSFRIYKEFQTGQFIRIGSVAYDSLSIYRDYASDPSIHSWSYKISAVDTCGNESLPSNYHRTLHLTVNIGQGVMNLIWDNYVGFYIPYYYIYRGLITDTFLTRIDSTTTNIMTYTDHNPPIGTVIYRIMVKPSTPCISAKVGVEDGFFSSSISNLEQRLMTTVSSYDNKTFMSIYPNPTNGNIYVELKGENTTTAELTIESIDGRVIMKKQISAKKSELDLSALATSVYIIKVNTSKEILIQRLVKD